MANVCMIPELKAEFATLADAYNNLRDKYTIRLIDDVKLTADWNLYKNFTLDLNGHELELSVIPYGGSIVAYRTSSVTVVDTAGNGKMTQKEPYTATNCVTPIQLMENSSMVWNSGEFYAVMDNPTNLGGFGIGVYGDASLTINGGKFTTGWYCASASAAKVNGSINTRIVVNGGELTSTADYAIYVPNKNGTLIINGGIVRGAGGAVSTNGSTVTINGGELTSDGTGIDPGLWHDGTSGQGNAVVNCNAKYCDAQMTVVGGDFVSSGDSVIVATGDKYKADVVIHNGTFNKPIEDKFLSPDANLTVNEDGSCVAVNPKKPAPVKRVDPSSYDIKVFNAISSAPTLVDGSYRRDF